MLQWLSCQMSLLSQNLIEDKAPGQLSEAESEDRESTDNNEKVDRL